MDSYTINQLNILNQSFYHTVAENFNSSRNYAWQGWEEVVATIKDQFGEKKIRVLDIGCGNGRFATFLEEKGCDLEYYGLDTSQKLLNRASEQLHLKQKPVLLEADLISLLQNRGLEDIFLDTKIKAPFDVVVCFGVLHHIPSFALRKKLLQEIQSIITETGVVAITAWLFLDNPTLQKRIIDFASVKTVSIDTSQLEEHDYLLDWQRGQSAIRYCHYVTQAEMEKIILGTDLTLDKTYKADSKTNNLNQYYLFRTKKESRL